MCSPRACPAVPPLIVPEWNQHNVEQLCFCMRYFLQYLLLVLQELVLYMSLYAFYLCYTGLIVTGGSDVVVSITALRSLSTRAFIETYYYNWQKAFFFLCLVIFPVCYVCFNCYVFIGIVNLVESEGQYRPLTLIWPEKKTKIGQITWQFELNKWLKTVKTNFCFIWWYFPNSNTYSGRINTHFL